MGQIISMKSIIETMVSLTQLIDVYSLSFTYGMIHKEEMLITH